MLRILLIRFWPVLIPLALYLGWYGYRRWRYRHTGEVIYLRDGPWWQVVIAMLLMAVGCFVFFRLSHEDIGPAAYQPAMSENGQVKQGSFSTP